MFKARLGEITMKKSICHVLIMGLMAVVPLFCLGLHADETADLGRQVFNARKETVVTMRVVIAMSFGGREEESEQESNATLVTPEGMAVLALSAVDPLQMASQIRVSTEEMTSRVTSLRMILPDGNEKPAEVVLRDKDLDIAFVKLTEKPETPLPYVDMSQAGNPQVLDNVVCIMQQGRVARRSHAAFVERVEMAVEKPRLFYALGSHRSRQVVCSPVFTMDNLFVGVGVMRMMAGDSEPSPDDIMVIIVPAAQLKELFNQIPAAS
jgi:hypothetical protein